MIDLAEPIEVDTLAFGETDPPPDADTIAAELRAYLDTLPRRRRVRATPSPADTGATPNELARYLRVRPDTVRAWITRGELGAVNMGTLSRPRFIVLPEQLAAFVKSRQAATPPQQPTPRRKRTGLVDYFPD